MTRLNEQQILNESIAEKEAIAALDRLKSLRSEERLALWLKVTRLALRIIHTAATAGNATCREGLKEILILLK